MTDKEHDLAEQLEELRLARELEAVAKNRAKEIKEEIIADIEAMGVYLYVDSDGAKRRAFYSDSETQVLDIDELITCVDEGLVSEDVLEKVAPRSQDAEALKRMQKSGRISQEVSERCVEVVRVRPTIRFSDPGT